LVLAFGTAAALARLLGEEGYGLYTWVISIMGMLMIPATLGMDRLLVKEIAALTANDEWGLARGIYSWAHRLLLGLSVVVCLGAGAAVWAIDGFSVTDRVVLFWLALPLVVLGAMTALRQGGLNGFHHVVQAQAPAMLVRPGVMVVLLAAGLAIYAWNPLDDKPDTTPQVAMALQVAATAVALAAAVLLFRRLRPRQFHQARPEFRRRAWLAMALPVTGIGGALYINAYADTLLIGFFRPKEEVGIYYMASRFAELTTLVLIGYNLVLAPTFSNLFARGRSEELQAMVTRNSRIMLLLSLPLAAGIIVAGPWLLGILGEAFKAGQTPLTILAVAQLFSVFAGPAGVLLITSGRERAAMVGTLVGALVNVIGNLILIPAYGINGAAVASALSLITWNAVNVAQLAAGSGIHSTALGSIGWPNQR
jgi:O-antigen/teichoic acid export membrane protein